MKFNFRPLAVALIVLAAAVPALDMRSRAAFSPDQRGEIEKIIRDYLLRNPEVLQEVDQEMERRQAQAEAEKHAARSRRTRTRIFNSRGRSSSAIRRATSPWSSSSTTIAASAARRSPTRSS